MQALHTAATGMLTQEQNVEVISHNIANMRTPGYKRNQATFQDLLYRTLKAPGAGASNGVMSPTGIQIGTGVKLGSISRSMEQGSLEQTSKELDIGIRGEGFFRIQMPDGSTAYTRDGSFNLDSSGTVVNSAGHLLYPGITIPGNATKISIGNDGTIQATLPGSNLPSTLGRINLARFVNKGGLESIGENLYKATAASGPEQVGLPMENNYGDLLQGHLEQANVSPVSEIVKLVSAQRAYELNSRVIGAADEMLSASTSILR